MRCDAKQCDVHDDDAWCNMVKHICVDLNAEVGSLQINTRFESLRDVVKKEPSLSHIAQHCHRVHVTSVDVLFCPFQGGFLSPSRFRS